MLLFSKDKKDDLKDELHLGDDIVVDIVKDETPATTSSVEQSTVEHRHQPGKDELIVNDDNKHVQPNEGAVPLTVNVEADDTLISASEMRKIANTHFNAKPSLEWLEQANNRTDITNAIYSLIKSTAKNGYYKLEVAINVCSELVNVLNDDIKFNGNKANMLPRFIEKVKYELIDVYVIFQELGYEIDIKFMAETMERKHLGYDDLPIKRIEISSEKPINLENMVIDELEVVFNLQW